MGGNELGDAGLQALRQLPGLTYLDLNGRQGTDSNVWAISMSDIGLEAILSLKELRELRFGCTSIGIGIEGAKFATVSAMSVNNRWLEQMKSLTRLEKLKLQGCDRVDDEGVRTLIAMPNLREKSRLPRVRECMIEVNRLENEADAVLRAGLVRLVERPDEVFELIRWKEVFGLLEEATDRAEDVADVLNGIVLENA